MSHALLRLVPASDLDDSCLSPAERRLCAELGSEALRRASRVAAKQAVCALLPAGTVPADVALGRSADGAPVAGRRDGGDGGDGPLPAVSLSHSAGWGAALAWLP
ncbi:hypothetical protein GCM10009616_06790 [Microlunatus lacustris]